MSRLKLFDLEEERVKQEISRLGAKRVLVQLPQGLKNESLRIAKIVRKTGALPIISADPCYGACDLAIDAAESLDADLIIHYGHSRLLKYEKIPTVYIEARAMLNVSEVVDKALSSIKDWSRLGLATTVQHVQILDEVKEILVRAGKTVMIGDAGRMCYPGQVIGCDYSNARSISKDVEAFLFICGGRFHALGLALSVQKPVVVADPYEKRVYIIDENDVHKILNKRWACIQEAKAAKSFAIFVGLKPGQKRLEEALEISKKLENAGKETCLLAVREFNPDVIMEISSIDSYVNTACPRISLDDSIRFKKPVITTNEARVVVGDLSWEDLCSSGWFGN
ncbi:MAG: diphthamide biosynthesis enzyme Dph2 [Candidatus Bathyarchaeota archaeon]|nr:diphthamide biosynthesis enzyme Dph2 [Candidatus Bathyarchaeota archaeon]